MANHGNKNNDDDLLIFIVAIAAICGIGWLLLPILKEYFLTMKMWQLEIISRIVPTQYNINLLNTLKNTPAYNWSYENTILLGYTVNYYFLPFILILFYLIFTFTKDHLYNILKYSKIYDRNSLLEQEKKVWKFLEPVAHKNLLENNVPGWESAKKPQEIAFEYNLLNNKKDMDSLNEEKARKYFALQLGELYTGMENLKPYQKALVGCFAEYYLGNKDDAYYALMDIAETFGTHFKGNISFAPGLELFDKYKNNSTIIKLLGGHAYVTTALASLFNTAKSKGIIISRYFLWLKEYDRKLYYILNAMGREVSWTECGGIFDHYQHEIALKRPLAKIFVNEAVNGLKEELKNVKLTTVE